MKKIYLASDSKARKKLLAIAGLKFTVLPSAVTELISPGKLSYAKMVEHNALMKARDVACRLTKGVVIAADTVCVQNGSIFGKPRDLVDAHRMLRRLSSRPHMLYSGLAVVDVETRKQFVCHEKTKIVMDKLTDREITAYFKKVSPLDKAGSFDIQGKGAFFIKRIEGCFYTVVGLPLRKLYRMLLKVNVSVFGVLIFPLLILSGCSTEYNIATKQVESYYYSTDREVALGQNIDRQIRKEPEFKFTDDPLELQRVREIGKKIVAVCDRKDIDYHFDVFKDEEVNAVSLPGGYVYVNSGLIEKVSNDDELAAVIAHEVGHIVARHSIKKLQASNLYSVIMLASVATPGSTGGISAAADAAMTELLLGYSREDELLADQLGTRYLKRAGYNPRAMIDFMNKLHDIDRRKPLQPKNYYKTHPYGADRIRVIKQELGEKIGFDDYINTEDVLHDQKL
ncbi:MAG TPA: Maf family nucleotide pyrophosphatase [Candidatus Omnitrophota bacterium]|nr:Maf family nucleotide pyrophosphatase [Candidatus Omnitrophota bacterium]HPT07334.1 Maf family nucleotide pyrophosphatase [Candidatus Omnitrophota bacterium]